MGIDPLPLDAETERVLSGVPLPGLYPPNAETRARYEAWAGAQG